ncbi:hypothetical protein Tco_1525125 [Tanacetum coccineum]
METEEVNERYITPCFVNGIDAYDREINLEQDKNMSSNEFAVNLCLEHEVKDGDKELILYGIDFGDIPEFKKTSLPPFVYKMGKSARNKKRPFENYQMNYSDEGPSLTNRKPLR